MLRKTCMVCFAIFVIVVSSCAPQPPAATQVTEPTKAEVAPTAVPQPTNTEVKPAEKAKIEMWVGTWGECFKPIVANTINPNAKTYEVIINDNPSGTAQKAAVSAGGGPDILITSGPTEARAYSEAGLNVPIDAYVQKYGWDKLFPSWALDLSLVNGKRYTLQAELETMILFYNKTLFEKKGYQPPKTFDELLTLAAQMKKDGIIPFGSAVGDMKWPDDYVYGEYLNAIAGPQAVYEALTGKRSWTDPVFVETFKTLHDEARAGWFMGGLDSYFTKTWDEQWAAVGKGEAGMTIQGTWMFHPLSIDGYFKDTGNTWDWVPMPRKDGKPVFDIGLGSAWAINKYSKHPDEAAEFLNTWFSPDIQVELLKTGCLASAPVKIPKSAMADLDPKIVAVYDAMDQAFANGDYGYTTWTFWPSKLQTYMQKGLEDVYNDQLSVDDYLKGADATLKEALAAGDAPPIPAR